MTHAERLSQVTGLYGIVDDGAAFATSPLAWAQALARGGARVIQLRFKRTPMGAALAAAREIRTALPAIVLLINDRPDLALLCEADGVHLGDDDLPVEEVRRLLGPTRLVGATARTVDSARARLAEGADHLGVGPVFASATKLLAEALLGLDGLRAIVAAVRPAPVVAISGIGLENIGAVAATGTAAAAVIGAVGKAVDPAAAAAALSAAFGAR